MSMRRTHIAVAVSAALISISGPALAAQPKNDELLKQLKALQATVNDLKQQVQTQSVELQKTKEASSKQAEVKPENTEFATTTDLEGLKSQLEDYKYTVARDREYNTAVSTRGLTIGGTLTTSYVSSTPNAAGTTSTRPNGKASGSTFNIGATMSFSGNLFRDYNEGRNLDYRFGLSYSNPKFANAAASTNSPAPGDSVVRVTDAYLQYSLVPNLGSLEEPKLTVQVGQQKIPFGLEGQVSDELKPTVSTAQFLGKLSNLGNRQIGVIFRGDLYPNTDYGFNYRAPLLEYALGAVNGNGANVSDDNSHKDYVGRLAFTVPADYNSWLRELKVGTSYYSGWKNLTSAVTPFVISDDSAKTRRTGYDFSYNHNPYGVTYERVNGVDDELINANTLVANSPEKRVRSVGQVLTTFFNFGDIAQWSKNLNRVGKFDDFWPTTSQVYFRYDSWDPNKATENDKTIKKTIGYNLFFAQTTKLQVGLTRTTYPGQPITASTTPGNELTALFQYGF